MSLKVHVDFNLETLARQLILSISEQNYAPFESPVILFSDKKVEQWFRLFWLKANPQGNGVVMNLACERFEDFLFSVLGDSDKSKKKPLTVELLRDMLIAKLSSDCGGNFYYKTLNSPEVNAYLDEKTAPADEKSGTTGLNLIHLYDFAEQMASLFIDYEAQRPEHYDQKHDEGIISAWQSGKDFFASQASVCGISPETIRTMETWQRKLYNDVFADIQNDYITLPQLYYDNLAHGKPFTFSQNKPVYLFGFSGMGQVYRTILRDFSGSYDLFVYLQGAATPSSDELAKKWSAFGAENISWWLSAAAPQQTASDDSKTDSVLHRMQAAVRTVEPFTKTPLTGDDSLRITAAATCVREVEYVHSKICALISEEHASQSDILVLAPDISAYRTAILEVFDQNPDTPRTEDSVAYPRLPYKIVDSSAMESLVCNALNVLLTVAENGAVSRPDFFALVRNPFVQKVRGITTEQVESWSSWISTMNVYRKTDDRDDWRKGLRRLLLARLTDTHIAVQDNSLYPFSDLASEDDASLNAFADCVDAIDALIADAKADTFDKDTLEVFKNHLDEWLDYADTYDTSFSHEQSIYKNALKEIERHRQIFDQGYNSILKKDFFIALSSSTENARFGFGAVFTGGITFANFQPNRILSAKYVFIMGLDSKQFPGTNKKNVLDLRQSVEPWQCDVSVVNRNKYAFLCQLMATGEKLFLSYVNKDLKKDEEFYCSSVVNDIISYVYLNDQKDLEKTIEKVVTKITVDETRAWNELFTSREFRNKKNYEKLQRSGSATAADSISAPPLTNDAPDRTTVSKLKKFLEDPFRFRVGELFTSTDDKADEEITTYEPIELNAIQTSAFIKTIITELLRATQKQGGTVIPKITQNTIWDYLSTYNETELFCTGELPQKMPFGQKALKNLIETVKKICGNLSAVGIDFSALVFEKDIALLIAAPDAPDETKLLTGTANVHWFSVSDSGKNKLDVLAIAQRELKANEDNPGSNDSRFLMAYLTALCVLAEKIGQKSDDQNSPYDITLHLCGANESNGWLKEECTLTPKEAYETLWKIYSAAFVEKYSVCVPVNLRKKEMASIFDLNDALNGQKGEWGYFDKKDMFDPVIDVGFTEENFPTEWSEATDRQNSWCRFSALLKETEDSQEAGED
ncbi:MAG: exodeoxyribonuclease V subunit gamma [Treponema sp.]|nr:exodeoxyribonuclease V subunit gamma [Treponema sp.]